MTGLAIAKPSSPTRYMYFYKLYQQLFRPKSSRPLKCVQNSEGFNTIFFVYYWQVLAINRAETSKYLTVKVTLPGLVEKEFRRYHYLQVTKIHLGHGF